MSLLSSRFWLIAATFPLSACLGRPGQEAPGSETQSLITKVDDLAAIPKPKSRVEVARFGRILAHQATQKMPIVGRPSPRAHFRTGLFSSIKEVEGIPRLQQEEVLKELLDPKVPHCGGVTCEGVFGFGRREITAELDEAYHDVKNSEVLARPEHRSVRATLLGSLQPGPVDAKAANPMEKKLREIVFQVVKGGASKDLHFTPKGFDITVDVKPSDLLRTEKLECTKDLCEAVLKMPMVVRAGMPLPLNSEVRIIYSHKPDAGGSFIEQKATINGNVNVIKIHEIFKVAVSFGADLEKGAATGHKVIVKNVVCQGKLSCNSPLASFNLAVDRDGIAFDALTKSPVFDAHLVKIERDKHAYAGQFKFDKIPDFIQSIKDGLAVVKGQVSREDMDFLWEQFADLRGPM